MLTYCGNGKWEITACPNLAQRVSVLRQLMTQAGMECFNDALRQVDVVTRRAKVLHGYNLLRKAAMTMTREDD